jgi:hypothetical protein
MGTRVSFYKINPPYSCLKNVIFEKFDDFREWYMAYPDEMNINLLKYFESDSLFKANFDILDQKLVDEITSDFVGLFDDTLKQFLKHFGPDVHPRWYINSTDLIVETKDETIIESWEIILNGRSIKNGKYFNGYSNDFKIGFLSNLEWNKLREKMEFYFKNIENVKDRFKEEERLGVEYLLTSLDETKNYHNEIVISIG